MKFLIFPMLFLLSACGAATQAHPEPIIVPQPVAVAVDAPCVPDTLGPRPTYVDSKAALLAAGPVGDDDAISLRLQLLYGGRAQREARLNELETVIEGCPRGTVTKK